MARETQSTPDAEPRRSPWLDGWKVWLPGGLVAVVGFAIAWNYMEPAPPAKLVIATGSETGAYHAFAERYAEVLAEHGIELEVRTTAGSVENYELLANDPEISLAIVQGGTASDDADDVKTLANLYLEPVWVFVRDGDAPTSLADLKGRTIAVGAAGSGTRPVAVELLAVNGVVPDRKTVFVPLSGEEAVTALRAGDVDAVFSVVAPDSIFVHDTLATAGVALLPFPRGRAYERRFASFKSVTLSEGVIDFGRNLPTDDVPLIAPTASLVANSELHSAFVPLLLEATRRVHGSGSLLSEPGTFPTLDFSSHPPDADARRWFDHGPPLLQRALPFWIASVIDRGKILLLPMLTLVIPLVKLAPPVIRWRIRSSVYRWYDDLRRVDQRLRDQPDLVTLGECERELLRMKRELDDVSVPLSYMEEFYNLRLHIDLVRRGLLDAQTPKPAESNPVDRAIPA